MFFKRLVTFGAVLSVSLSLAIGTLVATPQRASAHHLVPEGQNPSQFCSENDDFGLRHGECTSLFASHSGSQVSRLCKNPTYVAFIETQTDEEIKNHGQCIKAARALIAGS